MAGSSNKRVQAFRDRKRTLVRQECADPARRKRLEKDPEKWLKWYLNTTYTRPFRGAHKKIIDGAINAQKTRERLAVAAERGIGKSTLLWGLVLYFMLSGMERFPVDISFKDSDTKRALRFWKNALCFNERIADDYPEFCAPFIFSKGSGQRLVNAMWPDTGEPTGAQLHLSEGMIVMPDGLGVIGGGTINGNTRGLNHPNNDGSVFRPTLVLVDDPQSREVAKSPHQISLTIEVIDGDIGGLGEAGKKMPILMSGNCIVPGDVMDHYLNSSGWSGLRVPRIVSWPTNFDNTRSETRLAWDEWNRIRLDGIDARDGGVGAVKYYIKNKDRMTDGMSVSNEDGYDVDQGQPDALYGSMESYYTMGHEAFMAERQQNPVRRIVSVYDLSRDLILSRLSGLPRLHVPEGSVICMGIDINYVGFNWSVVSGDTLTMSRKVVAWGIWNGGRRVLIEKNSTDDQARDIIRRSMSLFDSQVIRSIRFSCGKESLPLTCAGWDASSGKWQNAVAAAIQEMRSPVQQWAIKAFGSDSYRPKKTDLRQGVGWHITDFPKIRKVLVLNADWWREAMQRGFVVEPTEPGALSLYSPSFPTEHNELVREILSEQLIEKVTTDKHEYYRWAKDPGTPNDKADATVYACALTGVEGIGEMKTSRSRRKRYTNADLNARGRNGR